MLIILKELEESFMAPGRLENLHRVVNGKKVLILTHNNPDPDAVATGWALKFLLKKKFKVSSELVYGGLITRAENQAMVRLLNIKIKPLEMVNVHDFSALALVDTQPGAGNNNLPTLVQPTVVIDHHGLGKSIKGVDFSDIRPHYGSSATILTEYLFQAGLPITKKIATALYYGIKTDTQGLGRYATEEDYKATIRLYPHIQIKILSQIETPEFSRDYFEDFDRALHIGKIYGDVVLCDLQSLTKKDMVALMSDFFLRLSGIRWSFVMGMDETRLIFSLRAKHSNQNAGRMVRKIIKGLGSAGGHQMIAGGQIPIRGLILEKKEKMRQALGRRFLKVVGQEKAKGERILHLHRGPW